MGFGISICVFLLYSFFSICGTQLAGGQTNTPEGQTQSTNSNVEWLKDDNSTAYVKFNSPLKEVAYISAHMDLHNAIVDTLFNVSDQNLKTRPEGGVNGTGPVVVKVTAYIQNIEDIDDTKMEYGIRLIYRQSWIDKRFVYGDKQLANKTKFLYLTEDEIGKIWTPDLFFSNEKEGSLHSLMKPNTFTRIYPHGLVFQSFRYSLKVSCYMGLFTFPFDIQRCKLRIASYGWVKAEVEVQWKEGGNPVEIPRRGFDAKMPNFKVKSFSIGENCNSSSRSRHEEYSCVEVYFLFQRKMALYFILIYIPSILIVVVSWASFWIDPDPEVGLDARFSLGSATLLTFFTQIYVATKDAPPTSYMKASDLWLLVCQCFIVAAFLEYTLVSYIIRRANAKTERQSYALEDNIEWILKMLKYITFAIVSVCNFVWHCCHSMAKNLSALYKILWECLTSHTDQEIASFIDRGQLNKSLKGKQQQTAFVEENDDLTQFCSGCALANQKKCRRKVRANRIAKDCDYTARILFPTMFTLFVICYAIVYFIFRQKLRNR